MRPTVTRIRANIGATTGIVNIVLPAAIRSSAVNMALVMMLLSSSTLTKMIMTSPLVWSSHPIRDASPGVHFRIRPASPTPISLPATETNSSARRHQEDGGPAHAPRGAQSG
jgi:hypothetical protein